MIKIITIVGTSIFTNYMDEEFKKFWNCELHKIKKTPHISLPKNFKDFEKASRDSKKYENYKTTIEKNWLKDFSKEGKGWVYEQGKLNYHASSEISSIIKIIEKNQTEKDFQILLFSTDTISSVYAAQIIQNFFENNIDKVKNDYSHVQSLEIIFNETKDYIEGLQLLNHNNFETQGVNELLKKISKVLDKKKNEEIIILNISAGYKVLTPLLTIIFQIEEKIKELVYLYEDENIPISLGRLPINFDWDLTETLTTYLSNEYLKSVSITTIDQNIFTMLKDYCLVNVNTKNELSVSRLGETLLNYISNKSNLQGGIQCSLKHL